MKPYPANTCAAGWAKTHITPRFVFVNVAVRVDVRRGIVHLEMGISGKKFGGGDQWFLRVF
jgi:hypothetical protein